MNFLKRLFSQEVPERYETLLVNGPRLDGSWTAELSKDGVPLVRVDVGSISALIRAS